MALKKLIIYSVYRNQYFWLKIQPKKIISLKRSFIIKLDALKVFKNINKIRMRQKILQLLSFKPMSKLAFRTLYNQIDEWGNYRSI